MIFADINGDFVGEIAKQGFGYVLATILGFVVRFLYNKREADRTKYDAEIAIRDERIHELGKENTATLRECLQSQNASSDTLNRALSAIQRVGAQSNDIP